MESPASDVELVWIQVREFKFRATSLPPPLYQNTRKTKFPSDELYLSLFLDSLSFLLRLLFNIPSTSGRKKKKVLKKKFHLLLFFKIKYTQN
jgi:hypothetical protein